MVVNVGRNAIVYIIHIDDGRVWLLVLGQYSPPVLRQRKWKDMITQRVVQQSAACRQHVGVEGCTESTCATVKAKTDMLQYVDTKRCRQSSDNEEEEAKGNSNIMGNSAHDAAQHSLAQHSVKSAVYLTRRLPRLTSTGGIFSTISSATMPADPHTQVVPSLACTYQSGKSDLMGVHMTSSLSWPT